MKIIFLLNMIDKNKKMKTKTTEKKQSNKNKTSNKTKLNSNYHPHIHSRTYNTNKKNNLEKRKKEEEEKYYKNPYNFKFALILIPNKIYKERFGLKLQFLIRAISIIYALRSLSSIYEQMKFRPNDIDSNLIINYICVFTSILLYISIYKFSRVITTIAYYVYFFHFGYKLYMSGKILLNDIQKHNYPINALIGIILGLTVGSIINCFSTWIVFSHMVFTFNYKKLSQLSFKI